MAKMIAKTMIGQEYIYSRKSAHSVPKSSAKMICEALNRARYQLKDGETWWIYDCEGYEMEFTSAGFQRFARRKGGRIVEVIG